MRYEKAPHIHDKIRRAYTTRSSTNQKASRAFKTLPPPHTHPNSLAEHVVQVRVQLARQVGAVVDEHAAGRHQQQPGQLLPLAADGTSKTTLQR